MTTTSRTIYGNQKTAQNQKPKILGFFHIGERSQAHPIEEEERENLHQKQSNLRSATLAANRKTIEIIKKYRQQRYRAYPRW